MIMPLLIETTLQITRSRIVPAERERVWQAITEPEQIAHWFEKVKFARLAVGEDMRFGWGEKGEIVIVEPLHCFAYRWQIEPECPDGTLVVIRLEAVRGGTRITVNESGFEALPDGDENFEDNCRAWDKKIDRLDTYLRTQIS